METPAFLVTVLILKAGCAHFEYSGSGVNAARRKSGSGPVSDQANLRSARKAYDVEGAGDLPGFLELLTDNVDWRFFVSGIPGPESSVEGRRAVEKYLISLFGALVVRFFPAEFIADANSVLVLGSEHVRLRSSGGTLDANWAHVFTFRDGLIARFREYSDTIDRPEDR